jgi:hypothetical protein
MHTHLSQAVAHTRVDDLHRAARQDRIAAPVGRRWLRFRPRLLESPRSAPTPAPGTVDITSAAVC